MIKRFFVKHRAMMLAALLIAVIYAVMFSCGITCPIRYVFGVSCPGCGMTRACMSALRLDFGGAFAYHPLWVLLVPFFAFLVVCTLRRWRRVLRVGIALAVCAMLLVYVWRMADPTDLVVVFAPQECIFLRLIRAFRS